MTTKKADTSSAKSDSTDQKKPAPKDAENRPTPTAVPGNARQQADQGKSTGMALQALEDRRADLAATVAQLQGERERALQDARNADTLIENTQAHIDDVDRALEALKKDA